MATNDRRLDLLELVIAHLPNAWERLAESGLDSLGTMTHSERQRWVEIIVHPYRKDLPTTYYPWDWLHRVTDCPAPALVMAMVLQLAKVPERERGSAPWLEVISALCPPAQRTELRKQLAEFEPSLTVTPLSLLDILDRMENDHTHV